MSRLGERRRIGQRKETRRRGEEEREEEARYGQNGKEWGRAVGRFGDGEVGVERVVLCGVRERGESGRSALFTALRSPEERKQLE